MITNLPNEVWLPVVGYEDLYHVSNMGRVKRLGGTPSCKRDRLLSLSRSDNNYMECSLQRHGKGKTKDVHRLVLEAFIGPCPEGMQCCHNDGNRLNNKPENLRWDTKKNNEADKLIHGTSARGENHPNAVLTEKDVWKIRELLGTGKSRKSIAAIFGVTRWAISDIANGKRWGWLE